MGDVIGFIGKMIPSRFNKYQTSNVKREIALLEIEIKRHVWHFFNYKSPFLGVLSLFLEACCSVDQTKSTNYIPVFDRWNSVIPNFLITKQNLNSSFLMGNWLLSCYRIWALIV